MIRNISVNVKYTVQSIEYRLHTKLKMILKILTIICIHSFVHSVLKNYAMFVWGFSLAVCDCVELFLIEQSLSQEHIEIDSTPIHKGIAR